MKFVLSSLVGVLFSTVLSAAEKKLNVPHFWQDNGCWCGVATVEMVEQFYRGTSWSWYSSRQANLAKPENNGGVYVGHTSEASGDSPCGPNGGLDSHEMLTVLNERLSDYGYFVDVKLSVSGSPKRNHLFHSYAMESIDENDVFLFAGKTRYKDGTTTDRYSHWYVIIGYKDSDGDPYTINESDGYYIHDAAVGAGLANVKSLGQKGKFVSHFDMVKHLGAINGQLYLVTTTN